MRTILCFGDSNTFGTNPKGGRHERKVRWPGCLAWLLGEDYYVIEEGMGGRTTVWEDPLEPNRCGIQYLPVALQSHKPLDMVAVCLGTNDCKAHFKASPRMIAKGAERLVKTIQSFDYGAGVIAPKILLISPVHIGEDVIHSPYASFDAESPEKSKALAKFYEEVARQYDCLYLDASKTAACSSLDQLHMDEENHKKLAKAVKEVIEEYFSDRAGDK
ncbi:MAG: SGNH/GDSL hydrolase family protein [Lachnospiraceae bacterium]